MACQSNGLDKCEILYGVVARGSYILASHSAKVGNFNDVAKDLLVKIEQQARTSSSVPSKMTYKDGSYLYHYSRGDIEGLIFMCITDDNFPRKHAFKFMDILVKKLSEQFPHQVRTQLSTIPFSMNSEFEPVINAEIKRANKDSTSSQTTVSCKYTLQAFGIENH